MLVRCSVGVYTVNCSCLYAVQLPCSCQYKYRLFLTYREKTNLLRDSFKIQKGEENYGYEYQNLGHPGTSCSCQGLHVSSIDKCPELERKVAGYLELNMECQPMGITKQRMESKIRDLCV